MKIPKNYLFICKINFLTFLFLSFCQQNLGQTPLDWCGTDNNLSKDMQQTCGDNFSYETDQTYLDAFEPAVFNVFFWGINRADGTSDDPMTVNKALEAVANLNRAFNDGNIFFKYKGINNTDFNHDVYYDMYNLRDIPSGSISLQQYIFQQGYKEPNSINIYVPYDLIGAPGSSGPHAESAIVG